LNSRAAVFAAALVGWALQGTGCCATGQRRSPPPGQTLQIPEAGPSAARTPEAAEGWRSLFDGKSLGAWKASAFPAGGEVWVEDAKLMLGPGDGLTGVTWSAEYPRVDYEVRFEGMRVSGGDFFSSVTFPVNDTFASLILGGWGGMVCGLSCLDGNSAADNETATTREFELGRWYRVRVRVTQGRIEAWVDDESVVDVEIAGRRVHVRPDIEAAQPLGLSSWRTTGAVRRIEWRPLAPARAASGGK
jgi:hypothetical protein